MIIVQNYKEFNLKSGIGYNVGNSTTLSIDRVETKILFKYTEYFNCDYLVIDNNLDGFFNIEKIYFYKIIKNKISLKGKFNYYPLNKRFKTKLNDHTTFISILLKNNKSAIPEMLIDIVKDKLLGKDDFLYSEMSGKLINTSPKYAP